MKVTLNSDHRLGFSESVVEVVLPHRVEYLVEGRVSIEDVIGSLQAQQKFISELGDVIALVMDGVTVEKTELRVRSIEIGSLREAFFVALFIAYQADLKEEIPPAIEAWTGMQIDDRSDTLVTVGVLLLVYYGAEYAYRRLTDQLGSDRLRRALEDIAAELAHLTGKSEPQIRGIVEAHLAKKGRLKELAKASIKFFRPSRNQSNEPILIGDRRIETDLVKEVPNQVDLNDLDADDFSIPVYGTRIALRAKDQDHDGSGWGGIVASISEKRRPVRLYPNVSKEFLWENDTVWADLLVTYRNKPDGGQEPVRYHIMKILDEPPIHPI
jgi:hypothetical protein